MQQEDPQVLLAFKLINGILGVVILLATIMGGAMLATKRKHGPALFSTWFRHLTNWNAIITSIWFIVLASSMLTKPNTTLLGFGYFVMLLNLFVFFVRWGWFHVSSIRSKPSHFFSDIIIHALVPLIACISVSMVAKHPGRPLTEHKSAVFSAISTFWIILLVWYGINYALQRLKIFDWPYQNGAGVNLPRDIYPEDIYPSAKTNRALWFYLGINVVVALALTILLLIYVMARE